MICVLARQEQRLQRNANDVPLCLPFSWKIVGIQMAHNFNCKAHPNLLYSLTYISDAFVQLISSHCIFQPVLAQANKEV